jgi:hypothetical protein
LGLMKTHFLSAPFLGLSRGSNPPKKMTFIYTFENNADIHSDDTHDMISLVWNMQLKKQYFLGFQLKKGPSGGPKRVSITLLRTGGPKRVSITLLRTKLKLILNYPLILLITKM